MLRGYQFRLVRQYYRIPQEKMAEALQITVDKLLWYEFEKEEISEELYKMWIKEIKILKMLYASD